ncbi:phosphatidylglycerophosphatase A [Mechercharimyces sp. CAU 1602]|uniref:phosphatidylglycerophosphatase A family protein n=1 Tax=Mechercharimyces sp. CAU 1602 TaxID=2973933 RepID=UPI0021638A9A|nr:phosphatidylglycerophosphatase A [Mechercharimyces sp. CAU 1602]MCS1351619.1 phosphatidylglycerophosphatase A [Mechercharimyces sp. CAU 1602]
MFYEHAIELLDRRGVTIEAIADIVYDLQLKFHPQLTRRECVESVDTVLKKREVQHAIITGVALDELAEQKKLPYPLQQMLESDEPLYGIDEIVALSITNVYGTIGLTSFGYLDKNKNGIISQLNSNKGMVHAFLDDLVSGIAAAASARIAHEYPDFSRYEINGEKDSL